MNNGSTAFLLVCLTILSSLMTIHAQDFDESEEFDIWNSHRPDTLGTSIVFRQMPPMLPAEFQNYQVSFSALPQTESKIAVNPLDPKNMIIGVIDYALGAAVGIFVSRDGGLTWKQVFAPQIPNTQSYGDPDVAFDSEGNAYVCGLLVDGSVTPNTRSVIVYKSTDRGDSWVVETELFKALLSNPIPDEPAIDVDRNPASPYHNTLYALSATTPSGGLPVGIEMQYKRSGASAPSPVRKVSAIALAQVPRMAFGLNGEIYVAYIGVTSIFPVKGGLYINRSTDGGETFSPDIQVETGTYVDTVKGFPRQGFPAASRVGPTPSIVVDTSHGPYRGYIYACYATVSDDLRDGLEIFLHRSTDGGTTWSKALRVNDDPLATGADQIMPTMAIAPNGTLGIAFYDRRDDPDNYFLHLYCAVSSDGGETFVNHRISTHVTDPMVARRYSSLAVADYIGIAAGDDGFFPVWNDGRTNDGNLDVYMSRVDIGTSVTSVDRTIPESSPSARLFPTPATSYAIIECDAGDGDSVRLYLVDRIGHEIDLIPHWSVGGGRIQGVLNTEELAAGTYFLRIVRGDRVETKSLVVTK